MRVDLFDFDLPAASIALRPARPRDAARLLAVDPQAGFTDLKVFDLPDLLRPGDALVFNDTRVIPARLDGQRRRAGAPEAGISATLHQRTAPDGWRALVKGARKLRAGDAVVFSRGSTTLEAMVTEKGDDGEVALRFAVAGPDLDLALLAVGHIPLPPYIASKRAEDDADRADYQTIYARAPGAVAAPTAGLHFTDRLLEALDRRSISRHFVTLHVGAGTFLPVKVEDTANHAMHAETGVVAPEVADALNAARANGGRIVAVGTTSLRLLESATGSDGRIRPFAGATRIFIEPGYRFRAVDALMTNFHLPRSTLFMLVAAFCGLERMHAAYAHAIADGYRFYSYGDSSLLFPDR